MSKLSKEILVVCGEASGDQHAAALVAELRRRHSHLHFFGMGGPQLAQTGTELLFSSAEVSVMGITEVLPKIPRILRVLHALADAARERKPVCAILVDIPDFNLRLARKLKALGIPVVYYISPMVWAWRQGRVRTIKKWVDRMLCILPFEEPFYQNRGVDARYVGNPVVEQLPPPQDTLSFRRSLGLAEDHPTLALLPGSRQSEIQRILPFMVEAATRLAQSQDRLQVVVPIAPGISKNVVRRAFEGSGLHPTLIEGKAPEVVGASDVAVVASGTATLEAGLMLRPLVVVYRVSWLSYWVGRLFLKVAHVALVNLLLQKRVVPELLQGELTAARIVEEVRRLWEGDAREKTILQLKELRPTLGVQSAAQGAADEVEKVLRRFD